jgi:pectate lyase
VEAEILWPIAGVAILTGRRIVRAWQTALSSSAGTQIGGKNGRIYVVTSPADDHVVNPRPGTLRYALTRLEPLWSKYKTFFLDLHTYPPAGDQTIAHEYSIQSCDNELLQLIRLLLLLGTCLTIIFARSMTIRRRNEGIMMSYKRLDGRGVLVHITSGASLTLQSVNHTIILNIYIHDLRG